MNAIDCRGLHKTYEGFALHDLSFSLPSGTILGLVGENGAGKSTTLRLLMNTIGRDAGSVSLLGVDNQSKDFLRVKQDIGIVLDESCLPETLTAREVGKLMALTYERWEPETFSGYLTRFSIPLDKANKDFSRGMKMKLALAVALSHRAKLLLLDFTREEDHTVVLSSHIVSDLEKVCDYIAFLHQGKLLLFEEKDRLLEEYALVRLPAAQLQELDPAAIAGQRVGPYGAEALVRREKIPAGFVMEHTSLEDIILFLARKGGEPG